MSGRPFGTSRGAPEAGPHQRRDVNRFQAAQESLGSVCATPLWQSIQVWLGASDWCMLAEEIAATPLAAVEDCWLVAIAAMV